MKVSLVLGGLCLTVFAGSVFAQEVPDVFIAAEPEPVMYTCAPPVAPPVTPVPAGFGDAHATIAAMRALLADPGAMAQPNAVSAAADAFVQHWDLVIADHVAQQAVSMASMIDGMMGQNGDAIDDFLTTPPIDQGPSLFIEPEFQLAVAPFAQVGGFFAP